MMPSNTTRNDDIRNMVLVVAMHPRLAMTQALVQAADNLFTLHAVRCAT